MTTYQPYIDQFEPIDASEAAALKANHVGGACRYLGFYTEPAWGKGISREEVALIHAHGLGIALNWEGSPTSLADITVARGQAAGHGIVAEVDQLAAPQGVGVWKSIDFDIQPKDFGPAYTHLEAVYKETGNRVTLGVYAKAALLEFLRKEAPFVKLYWQPAAWAYDVKLPWLELFQGRYNVRMAGHSVDVDYVQTDAGFWLPSGRVQPTPHPAPQPQEHWLAVAGWFPTQAKAEEAAKAITMTHHYHTWVEQAH